MAIARCGQCTIPFLREEIVANRCPACGAPLNAPDATERIPAAAGDAVHEDPGPRRRALVLAVIMPLILAAGLYLAFRRHVGPAADAYSMHSDPLVHRSDSVAGLGAK